ncbi:MAG: hypothetical protein MJ207_03355 [Bacilli bacterium]|nr:hypothetical protein [Bacilli bacterium]
MNKKRKTFLPLLVAAGCFLVACSTDKIIARPSWIDYEIISGEGLKDNKLKRIYDAVKKLSDTNPNLLTKLLYEKIGQKQLGSFLQYDKNGKLIPGIETFGSSEYDPDKSDDEHKKKLKAFIDEHPIYKSAKEGIALEEGERKIHTFNEVEQLKVSYKLIKNRRTQILNSIFEKLFNEINGGSYSVDNQFYEEKFLRSLRKQMYEVDKIADLTAAFPDIAEEKELLPRISSSADDEYGRDELQSWTAYVNRTSDGTSGFLRVFAELNDNKLTYYENLSENSHKMYKDYVNRKVLPEIYRETLTQIYVNDQNYPSLGRTYARKIHMISVAEGSYGAKVRNLFRAYMENMNQTTETYYTFNDINDAMRGIITDPTKTYADELLAAGGFEKITVDDTSATPTTKIDLKWTPQGSTASTLVYKGTLLGDLVEKYQKVYKITYNGSEFVSTFSPTRDEDTYKELTGNNAYPVTHGLELKEREIRLTSYIKDGWYLKNEGAEDLGDEFKKRLFDISTSKTIDSEDGYKDGDYVRKLANGKYYLTDENYSEPVQSTILEEADNSKIHIVEVEEAPNTSKLSKDINNSGSYLYKKAHADDATWSTSYKDNIVNDIVTKVASGDTYKKNAEEYFLMVSNIIFYDEDVYEYFKSQYPDLF